MTATPTTTAPVTRAATGSMRTCCDCQRTFAPHGAGDTICPACWQLTELDLAWMSRSAR